MSSTTGVIGRKAECGDYMAFSDNGKKWVVLNGSRNNPEFKIGQKVAFEKSARGRYVWFSESYHLIPTVPEQPINIELVLQDTRTEDVLILYSGHLKGLGECPINPCLDIIARGEICEFNYILARLTETKDIREILDVNRVVKDHYPGECCESVLQFAFAHSVHPDRVRLESLIYEHIQ